MESKTIKKAHKLYEECQRFLSSSEEVEEELFRIEDETEKEFWVKISDFFLQQEQKEIIKRGIF